MKAMKESAMKKMHASPKKAMKDPMKKMKDPMKAMKDPMKAMHASPKKAMSPKKKMTADLKATSEATGMNRKRVKARKIKDTTKKANYVNPGKARKFKDLRESPKKAMSPKKKLKADPPETQAKIKKMILSGIEKNKSDKEIMKKINSMSSGDIEYTYNRDKKQVKTRRIRTGGMGFEGEQETDPDKG